MSVDVEELTDPTFESKLKEDLEVRRAMVKDEIRIIDKRRIALMQEQQAIKLALGKLA